jgi:N-acetylmuramoyl-L-alanine amidase
MTIQVRQMLVDKSKYDIKCPYDMDAEYITFHNTANDASANAEVNYMIGNNNEVSFHFAIDDKEVVQALPLNRNAWHTGDGGKGDGNRKSIGVEVCYSKSGGDKYKKAEELAIKFIAQLLHERKWGIDRVKPHKYWTQIGVKKGYSSYVKNCPHRILDEGRWDDVLKAIDTELHKLNAPKIDNTYTIKTGDNFWVIENKLKLTHGTLQKLNPKVDANHLNIGQKIKIK